MSVKKKLITCAALTGTAVGIMHVFNRIMCHISTIDNLLQNDKKSNYEWTYGNISYSKQGSGSPILLLHDLNVCSSSYEWNKIKDDLAKTNTVYTLDLLGCGSSDKPALTYTNYLYVQLITDFIKDIIEEKTDVIATGHASSIALLTCANDSNLINRIMLVNPESIIDSSKAPTHHGNLFKHILYMPVIGTFIYNIIHNKKTIEQEFRTNYFYNPKHITEKDIETYVEASQRAKGHGKYLYGNIISNYTNANITNCLRKLDNSIYILVGNGNPENSLAASQYQNLLPSIEIAEIADTKHLPQMEKPEQFVENVKIYFEISEN